MQTETAAGGSGPEIAWVLAAQHGDRAAFGRLYVAYSKTVHAILLAKVPVEAAEDLVQEVFIQALRHLSSLRDPKAFPGWLIQIARNKAHDHHRRGVTWQELPAQIPAAAAELTSAESNAALSAIRSLPEAYRETLLMRLVEGMSGPEIAARTGLTHDSVRVNLSRGMKMLREKLS